LKENSIAAGQERKKNSRKKKRENRVHSVLEKKAMRKRSSALHFFSK